MSDCNITAELVHGAVGAVLVADAHCTVWEKNDGFLWILGADGTVRVMPVCRRHAWVQIGVDGLGASRRHVGRKYRSHVWDKVT